MLGFGVWKVELELAGEAGRGDGWEVERREPVSSYISPMTAGLRRRVMGLWRQIGQVWGVEVEREVVGWRP